MRTTIEGIESLEDLNRLIQESYEPTVIGICKNHSFGSNWLNDTFLALEQEYINDLTLYLLLIEDEIFADNLLGGSASLAVHFVRDCELKEKLVGSINNRGFKEKLDSILN